MESLTLTAPVTYPDLTGYTITDLHLDIKNTFVRLHLVSDTGKPLVVRYTDSTVPTGATMLHQINTGNFTVNSLAKKLYNQMIADGVLSGTVTGTPI